MNHGKRELGKAGARQRSASCLRGAVPRWGCRRLLCSRGGPRFGVENELNHGGDSGRKNRGCLPLPRLVRLPRLKSGAERGFLTARNAEITKRATAGKHGREKAQEARRGRIATKDEGIEQELTEGTEAGEKIF